MYKLSDYGRRKGLFVLMSFAFLFFMACEGEKDSVKFEEEEQQAYEAEESAEQLFDVIESITNSAIRYSDTNAGGRIAENSDPELACATIDFRGDLQSGRVEINFGDGCLGPDGKTRKGSIVVEYVGHWLVKGAQIFTVLKDFYIDDVKIKGTRILTNVSLDAEALVYMVEIVNGKVVWPDETYLTRASDRIHTLIFNEGGVNSFELQVEGGASGKTRLGVEYATEIVEPLVFKTSCKENTIYLPVSGIKSISIQEKSVISVNYGQGDCDTKFTISIDNAHKEVTL